MLDPLRLALDVADDIARTDAERPVRPWMWGPALLGFSLARLEQHTGEPRYRDWLTRYVEHYVAREPRIWSSDTVAPALITSYLADVTPPSSRQQAYATLTDRCLHYLTDAPRLVGDAVNHLGTSRWNWLYPKSVWVDSIMMFSVFPARYGATHDRPDLVELAARQPRQYAELLFDTDRGLWAHSWWAQLRRRPAGSYPREIAWARGNAWVVAALPMIIEAVGPDHPEVAEMRRLLRRTSAALRERQRPDGTWPTILEPEVDAYREMSATALVAAGWYDACRLRLLDETYLRDAGRALSACAGAVHRGRDGWEFREISGPTIPLPFLPRLGYARIRLGANHPYGVAALILAGIAADRVHARIPDPLQL